MLDLLDLYTHHRGSTIEGSNFPIDKYISVRIHLNQEANTNDWPRFLGCSENFNKTWSTAPSPNDPDVVNGRSDKTSPTSPAANAATSRVKGEVVTPSTPTRQPPREMTMRFTLDRERAAEEKTIVESYMEDSEEEYEMEVEEEYEVEANDRWEGRERHDHRYGRRGGRH
jgi:CTD kinase subunit beta